MRLLARRGVRVAAAMSLPVIDFSPFTAVVPCTTPESAEAAAARSSAQRAVATATHAAFSTYGFCYATGHGVDPVLLKRVFAAAEAFFDLPESEKKQVAVQRSPSRSRGWQRLGQNVTKGKNDLHEGFDIMRELPRNHRLVVDAAIHHGDCNQWPNAQPDLRRVLEEYAAALSTVGAAIMQAVAMGLGLPPEFFKSFYLEGFWIARMIRYPAATTTTGSVTNGRDAANVDTNIDLGCGEHTDYGCLTMVAADRTTGCLQVRGPDGSCE